MDSPTSDQPVMPDLSRVMYVINASRAHGSGKLEGAYHLHLLLVRGTALGKACCGRWISPN